MNTGIICWTYFDCTPTNVKSHFKSNAEISDQLVFMRNQQRNWETLQQCVALRCQPLNLTPASVNDLDHHKVWCFTFEVDKDEIFRDGDDMLGLLKKDCHGVPMISGLTETWRESFLMPYLITKGDNQNIWFESV